MPSPSKKYTSGDVITVFYFPHQENKTKGEMRWAICLDDLGDEFTIVPLKSDISDIKHHPNSFIIEADSVEGKRMKILNDSLGMPDRARQVRKIEAFIHGSCSESLCDKLHELVK